MGDQRPLARGPPYPERNERRSLSGGPYIQCGKGQRLSEVQKCKGLNPRHLQPHKYEPVIPTCIEGVK